MHLKYPCFFARPLLLCDPSSCSCNSGREKEYSPGSGESGKRERRINFCCFCMRGGFFTLPLVQKVCERGSFCSSIFFASRISFHFAPSVDPSRCLDPFLSCGTRLAPQEGDLFGPIPCSLLPEDEGKKPARIRTRRRNVAILCIQTLPRSTPQ